MTRTASRPIFIAGVVMLVAGLIPAVIVLISGWKAMSGVSLLSVLAAIGALLMA